MDRCYHWNMFSTGTYAVFHLISTRASIRRALPVPAHQFNAKLAADLGLEARHAGPAELAEIFSGNRLLPESQPIAMAYAGHQFGQFVPQLGDGRAILLGRRWTGPAGGATSSSKGSGRTP